MEENKIISHITKGLVIAAVYIIIDLAANFAGIKLENYYGWIMMCLLIGAIIWSCIHYGKQMDNNVTFGKVFVHGFKTSAVVSCLLFVYSVLLFYVISPELIDQMVAKGIEQAEKRGQDIPEDSKGIMTKMTKVFVLVGAILGPLILGCIASLIGAAVAKKRPINPLTQQGGI